MATATLTALEREFLQQGNSPSLRNPLLLRLEAEDLLNDFYEVEKGETPVSTPVA